MSFPESVARQAGQTKDTLTRWRPKRSLRQLVFTEQPDLTWTVEEFLIRPTAVSRSPRRQKEESTAATPCRCCGGSGRSEKDPIDQKTYMCGCCGGTGKEELGEQ